MNGIMIGQVYDRVPGHIKKTFKTSDGRQFVLTKESVMYPQRPAFGVDTLSLYEQMKSENGKSYFELAAEKEERFERTKEGKKVYGIKRYGLEETGTPEKPLRIFVTSKGDKYTLTEDMIRTREPGAKKFNFSKMLTLYKEIFVKKGVTKQKVVAHKLVEREGSKLKLISKGANYRDGKVSSGMVFDDKGKAKAMHYKSGNTVMQVTKLSTGELYLDRYEDLAGKAKGLKPAGKRIINLLKKEVKFV